jgi:tetratricopeptide (TPR) repeat protein
MTRSERPEAESAPAASGLPHCAACGEAFSWDDAYMDSRTPGAAPHNPSHGITWPRVYCPGCGTLVAECHILGEMGELEEWVWFGDNASVNAEAALPQSSGILAPWGKEIPLRFLPTWDEHRLDIERVGEFERGGSEAPNESSEASSEPAERGYRLLQEDEIDEAARAFDESRALGLNDHDHACALGSLGLLFLWKRGDVPNALRHCRESVEVDRAAYWQAHYILSLVFEGMVESHRAEQALRDAQRFALDRWWDESTGMERQLRAAAADWFAAHDKEELGVSEQQPTAAGDKGEGEADIRPLVEAASHGNPRERGEAVAALRKLGDPHTVEFLAEALQDGDADVRLAAADALGELADMRAVEPLIEALGDANERVGFTVAISLGKLGDPRAVVPLAAALEGGTGIVRTGAANALGELADVRAVGALTAALEDDNEAVRDSAATALEELGEPADRRESETQSSTAARQPESDADAVPSSAARLATKSRRWGIAGLFLWILVFPQILAIINGHKALARRSGGRREGTGRAIAGLCLGYLELAGFAVFIAAGLLGLFDYNKPKISALRVSPPAFRSAVGTSVSYRLSADDTAKAKFTIERVLPGVRAGGRCVARSPRTGAGRPCARYKRLKGSFTRKSDSGTDRFRFADPLAPGIYRFVVTARIKDGPESDAVSSPRFRVLG